MIDKIKVNLNYYVYKTIYHDMYNFAYFKPNGEINKNSFLNDVIYNFYKYKLEKRNNLRNQLEKEAILADVSEKNKSKMLDACTEIMDNYYNEDLKLNFHNYYFTVYPTKETNNFFDSIYENEIKNKTSYSSFIRKLLNEYAYLPQYLREEIVKIREILALSKACESNNVVLFSTQGVIHRIAPFKLKASMEETSSYLLGLDLDSKELKPVSLRLCRIFSVIISKDKFKFTKEQKGKLLDILDHGVEFASGDMVKTKIGVTDGGLRMLNYKLRHQPRLKKISDDVFEVTSTVSNFINYFIPFGKEIKILDNPEMKERMRSFYSEALESYEK